MTEKKGENNNNLVNKWAECDHFRRPLINPCLTFSHVTKQNANTASEGMKAYKKKSDRAKAKAKAKRFFTLFRKPKKKKIIIMWRYFCKHFMTLCSETLLKLNYKHDMHH